MLLHDSYRFPHLSFTRRRRLALLQHLGRGTSRFPLQVQTDACCTSSVLAAGVDDSPDCDVRLWAIAMHLGEAYFEYAPV